jgi:hypothetical protein
MNIQDYIEATGLDHLNWREELPDEDCGIEYGFVFMIRKYDDGSFQLKFGRLSASFLTMDDLSWCGPERDVVMWAPIKTPEAMQE